MAKLTNSSSLAAQIWFDFGNILGLLRKLMRKFIAKRPVHPGACYRT